MTVRVFQFAVLVFDAAVLVLSDLLYRGLPHGTLESYPTQIDVLCALALGLNLLFLFHDARDGLRNIVLFLRTLGFCLLILIIPAVDLRFLPATLGLTALLAFHAPTRTFLVLEAGWVAVAAALWLVFPNSNLPVSLGGYDFVLWGLSSAATAFGAVVVKLVVNRLGELTARAAELNGEIDRLASANLEFQRYASAIETESTRAERLRLSREIHDSAGYALTTLKMLFEAAKGLIKKNPDQLGPLMNEGARISQQSLQEIRFVLHELRRKNEALPEGLRLVTLLVKNFERACGVRVRLETTNVRNSYGLRVNNALCRMVQEGMTNAFRHGRATEVSVVLSEVNENLSVRIRDNGEGSALVHKGIGLSGMEERLAEAGGWMQYGNLESGFEVSALIPLQEHE